jgi:hypothetical protein
MQKSALARLRDAKEEKFVEGVYRDEIGRLRPCVWSTPDIRAKVDGYTEWGPTRLLLEAKLEENLTSRRDACRVLAQAVFYIRRFLEVGTVPTVVMIADRNECFIVPTSVLMKHTNMKLDWDRAASRGDEKLSAALMADEELRFFVHPVIEGFELSEVLTLADEMSQGNAYQIRITPTNVGRVYRIWKDNKVVVTQLPGALGNIMLFFEVVERGIEFIPRAGDVLSVGKFGEVIVRVVQLELFQSMFRTGYGTDEAAAILSKRDQLMEEEARRFQGAFYTPEIWRDHAIGEITRHLGENWMQECVVWDPAAGTGNLTRDRAWGCLISSTAEKTDVDVMRRLHWGGKHVFQYDFLNPNAASPFFEEGEINAIPPNVDKTLREAAKAGKRLVWFMNPPYAEDGDAGLNTERKAGVAAETKVAGDCRKAKMGRVSRQLYAQFMFRCRQVAEQYGFKDYTVALFSPCKFMSSGSYRPFRKWWYAAHGYEGGFLFQASHFADVSDAWGVSFTVWNSGGKTDPKQDHPIRLTDVRNFAVVTDGMKHVYNADDREASKWVEGPQKGGVGDTPKFSSGLKVVEKWESEMLPGTLGVLVSQANSLQQSASLTYFLSGKSSHKGSRQIDLLPSNWRRAVALYSARKLVPDNWAIHEDEYLAPDETKSGYDRWVDDCHIYALLHPSNNCTAMRDVQYKGKDWQIHNHWFWMTHDAASARLRGHPKTKRMASDLVQKSDPYFARLLENGLPLSPDARELLDMVRALWVKSLDARESFALTNPDLHLLAWDAGIYQLKNLWKEHYAEEWTAIKAKHKELASRLQGGVYEFGFLKK